MQLYISFLRGINVSGKRIIPMAALKEVYEFLGFQNVKTYIQSGNVLFSSVEKSPGKLCGKIENAIKEKWEFDVPVIIRTPEELRISILNSPFEKKIENKQKAISFLNKIPEKQAVESLIKIDFGPDSFQIKGREIYLYYASGQAKTKLTNNIIEKKLQVNATVRNWNTVEKMIALSEENIV